MPRSLACRIAIQLLEADVEAGFALVDEARAYRASGQSQLSARFEHDANEVVADIERRLQRLSESESRPFGPLLEELRNEIATL